MHIWRSNAFAEIHGAPSWFLDYAARHLSIAVEPGTKPAERFGSIWWYQGDPWGSLLHKIGASGRCAAGLAHYVAELGRHYGLPVEVHDVRERPTDQHPWWSVTAKPRPYQKAVHDAMLKYGVGVIDAPPRSGKTLMAAMIIDTLAVNTVYIAPTVAIVRQTYEVFVSHFGEDMVARLDGSATPAQKDISKPIVIATAASAVRQPSEWFETRKMLIIDEFHHAAAQTYHTISGKAVNAFYRFMLTGTHFRTGDDGLAMEAICSSVIHRVDMAGLIPDYLAKPQVFFCPVRAPKLGYTVDWREAYQLGVVEHKQRNAMIVQLAKMLSVDNGVPTLVLVRRRAHADALGKLIPNSAVVKGGAAVLTSQSVKRFLDGDHQVLIGTTVLGEGVDVPRAAALIYASGHADGVTMMQSYFRPLTAAPGKAVGRIYDFQDRHHRTLRDHARKRFEFAKRRFGPEAVAAP